VKARESGPVSYSIKHLASVASLLQERKKIAAKQLVQGNTSKLQYLTVNDPLSHRKWHKSNV